MDSVTIGKIKQGVGAGLVAGVDADRPRSTSASSTRVFHSPQEGHRPTHLGAAPPQSWQRKTERFLAMDAP